MFFIKVVNIYFNVQGVESFYIVYIEDEFLCDLFFFKLFVELFGNLVIFIVWYICIEQVEWGVIESFEFLDFVGDVMVMDFDIYSDVGIFYEVVVVVVVVGIVGFVIFFNELIGIILFLFNVDVNDRVVILFSVFYIVVSKDIQAIGVSFEVVVQFVFYIKVGYVW